MLKNGTFRLYQSESSKHYCTVFDLIDGNYETKQTKGLAYILSVEPRLLQKFLRFQVIRKSIVRLMSNYSIGYEDILRSDSYRVDAEMMSCDSQNQLRRDISISFYKDGIKIFVLIIEAKNIKLGIVNGIGEQLDSYFNLELFPFEENIPKLGIALTKYKQIFAQEDQYVSITWSEIIVMLDEIRNDNGINHLVQDYFDFITGVDKDMHFYEKEVLSVPVGQTSKIVEKFNVHAHPNTSKYNYKSSLYIAFRKSKGGRMSRLYKIDEMFVLDPHHDDFVEEYLSDDLYYKDRVIKYIKQRKKGMGFNHEGSYRFYILNEDDYIDLEHEPRPQRNNSGGWYYKLSELLNGKEIVDTDK